MKSSRILSRLTIATAFSVAALGAHAADTATDATAEKHDPAMTTGKTTASMKATLVDPEKKAKEKAATVKITTTGVKIVDPATVGEKAAAGQGHFHYRVDDGPVIATTAPKLSWHELTPGKHTIKVMLAGNDHQPLGPEETLSVDVRLSAGAACAQGKFST